MGPVLTPLLSMLVSVATGVLVAWANRRAQRWEERRERAGEQDRREHEALLARMDEQDAKLDIVIEAQQISMRSDLMHRCEKYLTRGSITEEEWTALEAMHRSYGSLGANGYMERLVGRCEVLPRFEI